MQKLLMVLFILMTSCSNPSIKQEIKQEEMPAPVVSQVPVSYFDDDLLVGYKTEIESYIKDFDFYVRQVKLNKNISNYTKKIENIKITFDANLMMRYGLNPNFFSGYCLSHEIIGTQNHENMVYINKLAYSKYDNKTRKKLIYHEMGHCILGSIHDNRKQELSIMNQQGPFEIDREDIEFFKELKTAKNYNLLPKINNYSLKMQKQLKYQRKMVIYSPYYMGEQIVFDYQSFEKDYSKFTLDLLNKRKNRGN